MSKNLFWKSVLVLLPIVIAVWVLYPPSQTLKPGIDLAGGTSLIYEIDTQGLSLDERRDLSSRMITVLRRRIDPANIQNLMAASGQQPLRNPNASRQRRSTSEAAGF